MSALLVKDILVGKKQILLSVTILIIYAVIFGSSGNTTMVLGFSQFFFTVLNFTFISYDEKVHFNAYLLSTSVRRKDIVKARYLMGILLLLMAHVIAFVSALILNRMSMLQWSEYFITITVSMFVVIIYASILLPAIFKWGMESIRILSIVVMLVPMAIFFYVARFQKELVTSFLIRFSENWMLTRGVPILVISSLILYLISYLISQYIFAKKDL